MPATRRPCARCDKPLSKNRGLKRRCYRCETIVKREHREAQHEKRVENLYGLLPGEYQKIYESQGGHCAVCPARGVSRRLAVDHDHKLGMHNRKAIRGLLCVTHNKQLGYAHDDPEVFDRCAEYLRDPPARKVLE